ncbi:nitrilase-related carbon-nitrogen hydrolase [Conexibacter arvalis]|uniref:Putative amidohydrolase n=1 Tax=Conexibacter arvalis TaxID=912552 RepID=A0A840IGV7_9ACTN|nr:nitrilase-related carbon-nitrogen hydrolase [Conexibacter arvalis]MBB4663304.1 putative amidohydrolase [Conexibacter arvalis]
MRVLLAQLAPAPGDLDANAAAVAAAIAAHPDAELAVFPELFLTGYDPARAGELALGVDESPLQAVRAVARRHGTALLLGFVERLSDGRIANAVACMDTDGTLVATYRKTHLFGGEEREVFAAGEELLVVELAGRRLGVLNCYDVEFPEPARALARAGSELLVTVAANMEPYGPDHALAAQARALDNRLPHVYVNRVGEEAGLTFVGGSFVAGPDGQPLAALDAGSQTQVADVPLGAAAGDDVDYLAHLRDDLVVKAVSSPSVQGGNR